MRLLQKTLVVTCLVGASASSAVADSNLRCDVSVDAKDTYTFQVNYVSRGGNDTFTGVYTNPSAGAQASISGSSSGGSWKIFMAYTDAKHKDETRQLTGKGQLVKNELQVTGDFVTRRRNTELDKGTFTLRARCK